MKKEINVNQLCAILDKHYNGIVHVEEVKVLKQGAKKWECVTHNIGVGRVCNLTLDIKPKKRWWKRK